MRKARGGHIEKASVLAGHLHRAGEGVHLDDAEGHAVVLEARALVRQLATGVAIEAELVGQAAEKPSAGARDLHGVEREVLVLGHLDGHGHEFVGHAVAAEHAAAYAAAAGHAGLVAHADLPKLDSDLEHRHEVLHELAKIHARLGAEVEEDLRFFEEVVRGDQLHGQIARRDLLLAGLESLLLALVVRLDLAQVLGGRDALDRHDLVLGHLPRVVHDALELADIAAVAGGHDDHGPSQQPRRPRLGRGGFVPAGVIGRRLLDRGAFD